METHAGFAWFPFGPRINKGQSYLPAVYWTDEANSEKRPRDDDVRLGRQEDFGDAL